MPLYYNRQDLATTKCTNSRKISEKASAGRDYSYPAFMFYTQLFILKDSLIHFWKIKKVGNGHIQSYCKAVQSSESNILCLSRHNVLYGRMA